MSRRSKRSLLRLLDNPQLLVFSAVRVGGLALRPLVIFTAVLAGRNDFAQDYALLISALASVFVLTHGHTHIDYYKRRFRAGGSAVRHAYQGYFADSLIHLVCVLPLVLLAIFAWTNQPDLVIAILLLVVLERFFDEEQRHFLFTREYGRWSLAFAARLILPSALTLGALWIAGVPLVPFYVLASAFSFIGYLFLRKRHSRLYIELLAHNARLLRDRGRSLLHSFWRRWRGEYAYNQLWSFLTVNIYLADRFWVASQAGMRIDTYVFFATLFNTATIGHSLFYFTPRKPHLIRAQPGLEWHELTRPANLLLPVGFALLGLCVAYGFREFTPTYGSVPLLMLAGMALFFSIQAAGLVVVETVFWRVSRKRLVVIDAAVLITIFALFVLLEPPVWSLPWIASAGAASRLLLYLAIPTRQRSAE